MNKLRIYYFLRYYYRKIIVLFGFCPDCGTLLNYTSNGRPICPECGKAK